MAQMMNWGLRDRAVQGAVAVVLLLSGGHAVQAQNVVVTNPLLNVLDTAVNASVNTVNTSVTNMNTQLNANVDNTRNTLVNTINDSLRSHAGQMTANGQQATQADASMRDTQDNRRVQGNVEQARYNAMLAVSTGTTGCNILTGIVGSTPLFRNAGAWRDGVTNLAMDYQMGESPDSSLRNGTQAAIEERVDAVCAKFGTQSMIDEGVCKGPSPTQKDGKPGRVSDSLNANVLLETDVLTPSQQDAARLFISNAFISAPMGPVARNIANTPEGRDVVAARWSAAARNSIALTTFTNSMAVRVPIKTQTTSASAADGTVANPVQRWAEGTASRMLGGRASGQNYPSGVSLYSWMDLRARSWYLDPVHIASTTKTDANSNTQDMLRIMGFNTFLQWEQFKQQERTNVLLATVVSMMNEQTLNQRAGTSR